ncbi:uncharacterized protein LOC109714398 isoform X3 [Ananas comosus]|uniref:Uncharacterized protein LOC109714398 isoform X3 n=1 Tax=Ananas comosus TaxID=4615 RepID=A0A6P5FMB2_ANACO|nr:uncharacterized protein LOC109714398 isoform X3 [Ananas comosus]
MVCTYHCRQMVKSEFMVAFNTLERQVGDYQARLETLHEQLCRSGSAESVNLNPCCWDLNFLSLSAGAAEIEVGSKTCSVCYFFATF